MSSNQTESNIKYSKLTWLIYILSEGNLGQSFLTLKHKNCYAREQLYVLRPTKALDANGLYSYISKKEKACFGREQGKNDRKLESWLKRLMKEAHVRKFTLLQGRGRKGGNNFNFDFEV